MANDVLVFAEHQGGKIVRPTWEALAAGQHLAQDLGTGVSAVVLGAKVADVARELATVDVADVLAVDSPLLAEYTAALRQVVTERQPRFLVFSHTYQVRDFAPKLAAALKSSFVSDCLGYRKEGDRLIFLRQVFQGKFNADVEVGGEGPALVSFQAGSFREDSVRRGAAAVKVNAVPVTLAPEKIRTKPGERFREAKQAVDL